MREGRADVGHGHGSYCTLDNGQLPRALACMALGIGAFGVAHVMAAWQQSQHRLK
jgi:hypothetical protein